MPKNLIYQPSKKLLLLFSDFCAYLLSMSIALLIRGILPDFLYHLDFPGLSYKAYFSQDILLFFWVMVIVFITQGLYQLSRNFWNELVVITKAIMLAALIAYLFLFNVPNLFPFLSRTVLILLFLLMLIFVPLCRIVVKKIIFITPQWQDKMVIFCQWEDIEKAIKLADTFSKDFYFGNYPIALSVEAYKDSTATLKDREIPIYTNSNVFSGGETALFIGDSKKNASLIQKIYSKHTSLYILLEQHWVGLADFGAQFFFSERIFVIPLKNQLHSRFAQFIKFMVDRILGLIFVLILCPVFLILALIIRKTSEGPIFYGHERIGKNGVKFKVWKFRSMYMDADVKLKGLLESNPELKQEWEQFYKLKNDPRITPIGSFIRKYSLDELPQLFNVVLGDMSLVGPRPFVEGEIEGINPDLLPMYAKVKPGLTGLWQISGRNDNDRMERVQIDRWYIQNWTVSLDLLILLNTPKVVFTGRGAS